MLATLALASTLALVTQEGTTLRAAPRDAATVQAQLTPGDLLEVRGQRLDYLQVWDHRRERGGFVRASQLKLTQAQASDAPELLHVLRFVRETPGQEALGVGLAATWLQASPAGTDPAEALDAIGTLAERLARRASTRSGGTDARLSAQLDGVTAWGVRWQSFEQNGQMRLCYDGEAFRRVLALPGASPEQKTRAALGLTRPDCLDPASNTTQRQGLDRWRVEVLDRITPAEFSALPTLWQQRLQLRRAATWASLAFTLAQRAEPAQMAGQRALDALAAVNKSELPDDDQAELNDTAIRVGATRWSVDKPAAPVAAQAERPQLQVVAGQPGESCVLLTDARHGVDAPLLRQCTWGVAWTGSARLHPNGKALVLAVQPLATWSELWLMKAGDDGRWSLEVLPPAAGNPLGNDLGVVEFAGWVPGKEHQLLLAREARVDGRYSRRFEVTRLATGEVDRQASTPQLLAAFQRWQDPAWKRQSVMLR